MNEDRFYEFLMAKYPLPFADVIKDKVYGASRFAGTEEIKRACLKGLLSPFGVSDNDVQLYSYTHDDECVKRIIEYMVSVDDIPVHRAEIVVLAEALLDCAEARGCCSVEELVAELDYDKFNEISKLFNKIGYSAGFAGAARTETYISGVEEVFAFTTTVSAQNEHDARSGALAEYELTRPIYFCKGKFVTPMDAKLLRTSLSCSVQPALNAEPAIGSPSSYTVSITEIFRTPLPVPVRVFVFSAGYNAMELAQDAALSQYFERPHPVRRKGGDGGTVSAFITSTRLACSL